MRTIIVLTIAASIALTLNSQKVCGQADSLTHIPPVLMPYYKNVIKFNPTPMLMWGEEQNLTFSYERLLKNNQSFAIQAGFLTLFNFLNDTIAETVITDEKRWGVNLACDYRLYLWKRNSRPAPDGLYLGGYLSYYGLRYNNIFNILDQADGSPGTMMLNMNFVNLGFELGYQFIFRKRFSLDLLLFGPSLSCIFGKLEANGQLSQGQIDKLDDEMVEKVLERFPSLDFLLDEGSLNLSGGQTSFHSFFRYCIQIGYHF